jgi:hypothetical protein
MDFGGENFTNNSCTLPRQFDSAPGTKTSST